MEYTIVEIMRLIDEVISGHMVRIDDRIDGLYAAIIGSAALIILSNILLSKYNDRRQSKRGRECSMALCRAASMFSVYLRDKVLEKKALEQQSALSVNAS